MEREKYVINKNLLTHTFKHTHTHTYSTRIYAYIKTRIRSYKCMLRIIKIFLLEAQKLLENSRAISENKYKRRGNTTIRKQKKEVRESNSSPEQQATFGGIFITQKTKRNEKNPNKSEKISTKIPFQFIFFQFFLFFFFSYSGYTL